MMVPQLSYRGDGIQSCVLRQCERNHVQSLGKRSEAILLHARQSLRVLQQADR